MTLKEKISLTDPEVENGRAAYACAFTSWRKAQQQYLELAAAENWEAADRLCREVGRWRSRMFDLEGMSQQVKHYVDPD